MHCQACGADLPNDARFCIECGADIVGAAHTGATVQLPRPPEHAVACRSCGAANPDFAVFCVRCGRPMAEAAPAPASVGGLGAPQTLARSAPPAQRTYRGHRHQGRAGRGRGRAWEGLTAAIFMFGLAALFLLKLPFWPGILIVCAIVAFVSEASRGRYFQALSGVLWLFGLAILFTVPKLWWPGILVLIGLSVLLDMARRGLRRP